MFDDVKEAWPGIIPGRVSHVRNLAQQSYVQEEDIVCVYVCIRLTIVLLLICFIQGPGFSGDGCFVPSQFSSVQFGRSALCDPMDCSMPGFPVHHQLPELTQTHVHRVGDAIQPSHPLLSPSSPTFNLSQHQGLFQWVGSSHQEAKVLEFQFQHQSFQWIFKTM